jgi:simple sugar transport system substrate-binding protein
MIHKTTLVLAALATAAALGTAQAQDSELKVGFIYVGPVGDYGWSYQHDQGRQAIEEEFGDRVDTTYVESVAEGPDAERVIRQLAASGHGLIFTTSFGFMDPTVKVAKMFPDAKFEHATGYQLLPNLAVYMARFYEGRHIIGKIAGMMSKTNKIGYIASFPIPEVVRGINAATLAAREVNPDIEVQVVWVNTWYDPGKEADAAKALISQGADMIMQHTDSPAPLQVAENAEGVFAFGQASDMIQFAPNAQLTAIVDDWHPYYIERTRAVLEGTWESSFTWDGLAEGMVAMAPYTNMPDDVRDAAMAAEKAIASGELHPFTGPIKDRDGTVRIKEDETATDEMLLGMDWFVEGVKGDLPK